MTLEASRAFQRPCNPPTVAVEGGSVLMAHLLCLLIGHKKTLLAFSHSRFYCQRCGIDLGVTAELLARPQPPPMPPTTIRKVTTRRRLR